MNRRQFLASCGLAGCLPWAAGGAAAGGTRPATAMPTQPRITREKIHLKLTHTWAIARGAADFKENVIVRYERDGLVGVGEAGHLTAAGQTAEQTMSGIDRLIPLYEAADPFTWAGLPERARAVPEVTPPARAAIELALMDWVGQALRLPLHRLFGLDPRREVPTSFSIGLDTPEIMRQKVREAGAYRLIKVKLGRDDDEDIIRTLRSATDKPIRVDANEGWKDKEQALRRIEWLATQNVELVEQPMPRKMIEETRWIRERTAMPLIADEAVDIAADIPRLAGAYTGVNIKLMKAGGVIEALRMFQVARAHGLDAMLGCMIETSVAITAAVQLQSLARWVDLDGSLLLQRDPFVGATFHDGAWRVPTAPGLGVKPVPA
jgi:L-Ala-D/L-Glu epimerase